ncbi:hypothetical protein KBD81_04915 [Candidatus Woesebacteria bacterium]|nr:hypothetical protein [Candidatus Woesebacteria bacterium]
MASPQSVPDRILKHFEDIYSLPPNDLHNSVLTRLYKMGTAPLKSVPFLYIIPLSVLVAAALYLLTGQLVIKLVSLLQYGF